MPMEEDEQMFFRAGFKMNIIHTHTSRQQVVVTPSKLRAPLTLK
jgi:hypothetical protein